MSLTPEQTHRVLALVRDFARQGDVGQLSEFLDHGIPVDLQDDDGNTLLMLAAYHGQVEVVRALQEAGADLDAGTPSARQAAEMFGRDL